MSQPVKKKTLTSKLSDEPEDTSTIVEPTKHDAQSDEHIGIDVEIPQAKSATVDPKETSKSAQTPDSNFSTSESTHASDPSFSSSTETTKSDSDYGRRRHIFVTIPNTEFSTESAQLSRDRIVEPTKPDAESTIDKPTETEAEEKRLKIEATKAKAMAIAEKNQIAASTSVKPTQPTNASTNAKTTDPDLSLIDASTNAQTTEPNPLRQSSYEYTVEPNELYEPNSSDLKILSTLGIPSEISATVDPKETSTTAERTEPEVESEEEEPTFVPHSIALSDSAMSESIDFSTNTKTVDFLEPLSPTMFDIYGLEQKESAQTQRTLSFIPEFFKSHIFKYGHGSEFDFEKLKKDYESNLQTKVMTYEYIKYDHYVAKRNRIIENTIVANSNFVTGNDERIYTAYQTHLEEKRMREKCSQYTEKIELIYIVLKLVKHYPNKTLSERLKLRFIDAVKTRQELVKQIPEEITKKIEKKVKSADEGDNGHLHKLTRQSVIWQEKLQKDFWDTEDEKRLAKMKNLPKKKKLLNNKANRINHSKPTRRF